MFSAIIKYTIRDYNAGDPFGTEFMRTDIFREIVEAQYSSFKRKYNPAKRKRKIIHNDQYEE